MFQAYILTYMSEIKPWIQCRHCAGTGTVTLSDKLNSVLKTIRRKPGIDSLMLAKTHRTASTAMNNRLADLLNLGFVIRTRQGKLYQWTLSEPKIDKQKYTKR